MRNVLPLLPVLLMAAAPPAAYAQASAKAIVDQAKAAGVVGEQGNGMLGIVSGADPRVAAAVNEINTGRAAAYRDAAAKSGVSEAAAGEAAYRLLLARMPPGQFYKPAGEGWMRK